MFYKNKMGIDLFSLIYLSFRLAPFILVSFFVLSSVLNQDIRGMVYLGGLLLSCVTAILLGNSPFTSWMMSPEAEGMDADKDTEMICNVMTLGTEGRISKHPLSLLVFSFTLGYLVVPILKRKTAISNIPTLIIFPALCLAEIYWNFTYGCAGLFNGFFTAGLGLGLGIGWAWIFYSNKLQSVLYSSGISSRETCNLSNQQMICTVESETSGKN
jgi:hypothetical protein